jgi:hypothetical protein
MSLKVSLYHHQVYLQLERTPVSGIDERIYFRAYTLDHPEFEGRYASLGILVAVW